jgi:hypothetical protein
MFPGLTQNLKDAARIEITHQGKTLVLEKRPDGGWGVASMRDYPIQETKLRGLLTGLTELRLTEPRTSDPAEFSRLGVEDPNGTAATGDLLRVMDGAGRPILQVILGHRKVRSRGNAPEEVYVRRPDETQSWLAQGSVQADADSAQWLDRDIMNIAHDKIASVVVGDNELVFGRQDGKFVLTQPADHPKLDDYKVEDVSRALEQVTLQTVKADGDAPGTEAGHSVFTTSDGLAVAATVLHADKDVWVRFKASGDNKAEADKLNARLGGWTYQVGSWKEKSLVPTLDGLKAPEPPKPAAAVAPAEAPPGAAAAPVGAAPVVDTAPVAQHVPARAADAPAGAAAAPAPAESAPASSRTDTK